MNRKNITWSFVVFSLLIISSYSGLARQTRGVVKKSLSFTSKTLEQKVNYSVYLPAGYAKSNKKYPVFYLLHGYTDDETTWLENGWVDQTADRGILDGSIAEMIIVMPDAGLKWYVNQPDGKFDYETMFITELIPHIDETYRTLANRENRAVGGLSMGGFGALGYSMRHPDVFSICLALSSAIRPDDETLSLSQKHFDGLYAPVYGKGIAGEKRLSPHWKNHNPITLAETLPTADLQRIHWHISCGDDDYLEYGSTKLHRVFKNRNIPHEFRIYDGAHNWVYWRTYIKESLEYMTSKLPKE